MTAFEQWWYDQIHIGEGIAPQEIWNAALEHAAKICESKYGHYDGSQHNVYIDADECAETIRKEISK